MKLFNKKSYGKNKPPYAKLGFWIGVNAIVSLFLVGQVMKVDGYNTAALFDSFFGSDKTSVTVPVYDTSNTVSTVKVPVNDKYNTISKPDLNFDFKKFDKVCCEIRPPSRAETNGSYAWLIEAQCKNRGGKIIEDHFVCISKIGLPVEEKPVIPKPKPQPLEDCPRAHATCVNKVVTALNMCVAKASGNEEKLASCMESYEVGNSRCSAELIACNARNRGKIRAR